jgi:hypothetical protein
VPFVETTFSLFVLQLLDQIPVASDAFHAEAIALSIVVQIAEQTGVGRVVFETDCIVNFDYVYKKKY